LDQNNKDPGWKNDFEKHMKDRGERKTRKGRNGRAPGGKPVKSAKRTWGCENLIKGFRGRLRAPRKE